MVRHQAPPPPGTPQLDGKDIHWGFIADYYDGPISGVVKISGVVHWADCYDEAPWHDSSWYRRYKVYRLSGESANEQTRRQQEFERYVGTHWTDGGEVRPQSEWHKFYDLAATWPEWEPEGEVVGWFEY